MATTVGGVTTRYAWDLGAALPVILAEGSNTEYICGHDLIGRIVTSGGVGTATYAHTDVLSSVQLTADGSGTEVQRGRPRMAAVSAMVAGRRPRRRMSATASCTSATLAGVRGPA